MSLARQRGLCTSASAGAAPAIFWTFGSHSSSSRQLLNGLLGTEGSCLWNFMDGYGGLLPLDLFEKTKAIV